MILALTYLRQLWFLQEIMHDIGQMWLNFILKLVGFFLGGCLGVFLDAFQGLRITT